MLQLMLLLSSFAFLLFLNPVYLFRLLSGIVLIRVFVRQAHLSVRLVKLEGLSLIVLVGLTFLLSSSINLARFILVIIVFAVMEGALGLSLLVCVSRVFIKELQTSYF